ncbi:TPA: Fic family protein [Legionella pneumophila]|nr:Fic family protein [Legionella pneumophila]MDW9168909.1 Fic family protein [Legionella pneumophila subsp. fraseri]MDX1847806.1 Fic family protein [Legionella pneumophila subsp. fraseri]HAT1773585.1 Fic family protein [Legionella pneumophila]HAT1884451.1 Fic family protein [Legionella pneumophila]HAT2116051.1 Fic family protein [Legionella pneumophila]
MTEYIERIGEQVTSSVAGETYTAYVPKPLPPSPSIEMDKIYPYLDQASLALGRLDGLSIILPDPSLFLYMYIRKEAVLSSQIEGTQSSLSDLLLYENQEIQGVPDQDVVEVSNYVAAIEHGLERIKNGFPLSLRLIRDMHEILLNKGRGSSKQPGEFRRSQNWIGGTRPGNAKFVPPPPERLMETLDALEKFLHDETIKLPTLVKAALAHHQFETIHPFLDGNGRLGRLLITFILCVDGIMEQPMLYLSLYFKTHRQQYYDHLQLVRDTGDWEEWLQFFLKGVVETANQAVSTAQAILTLFREDRKQIELAGKLAPSLLLVHYYLQKHPTTDSKKVMKNCNISLPTANSALNYLLKIGIVKEITGRARNKIYVYQKYLDILSEGALPY